MSNTNESRDEARLLLTSLTLELKSLNTTLQRLMNFQAQRLQSDQALASYMAHLSTRADEVVQRIDASDHRLDQVEDCLRQLVQTLSGGEEVSLPPVQPERGRQRPSFHVPTPGQFLGGVVGYGLDYLGSQGGYRRRGR